MKIVSISGITCYVADLDRTTAFYESLGFRVGERTERSVTVYVNWFWMTFVDEKTAESTEFEAEATTTVRGGGQFTHIKVDDVDAYYSSLVAKGVQLSSEPRDWPWGSREFALRDPDGYKLVFFSKL
jgi:catechol 2,3-dioxygenase-like lactoylglutathione lyase family enzyme